MKLADDKSIKMTLPEEREVHGFTVRKIRLGEYLTAMKQAQELPEALLKECFDSIDLKRAVNILFNGNQGEAAEIIVSLLVKAPEPLIRVLCEIMRLDPERVLQELTPSELTDVVKAFWELNDLNSFFGNVWGAVKPRLHTLQAIGFSGG